MYFSFKFRLNNSSRFLNKMQWHIYKAKNTSFKAKLHGFYIGNPKLLYLDKLKLGQYAGKKMLHFIGFLKVFI